MTIATEPAGAGLDRTLAGSFYCDPSVLETDIERIFRRAWLCAGRRDAIARPGGSLEFAAGRLRVRLGTAPDGSPRAVAEGVDRPLRCSEWAGFVFVGPAEDDGGALEEHLGDLPRRVARYPLADLGSALVRVDDVPANWKILIENFMECYHCPGVHPELCDLVPLYRRGLVDPQGGDIAAYFREGAWTFTLTGRSPRSPFPDLSEEERRKYDGELILPNLMLNLLPDFAYARTLWPLAPDRTRIVSEWLFHPGEMARPGFDPSDAIEFTGLVARQDWDVCSLVQRGVASGGYRRGIYLPREAEAAGFIRWYLDRLRM